MQIGIVGHGTVGRHLVSLFSHAGFSLAIYDKYQVEYATPEAKCAVQSSDLVFVAVPTNQSPSGAIDLTQVEDAVSWIERPICIKSTITPGTTDKLIASTHKPIIFSPEYVGETPYHKYNQTLRADLLVLGGRPYDAQPFLEIYKQALGPDTRYFVTDAVTAELAKYMENCFFATKLAFVAQFYALAQDFGADFNQLREIWVSDSRVGLSHSLVIGSPGFAGKCLPKDLSAIIEAAAQKRGAPLLEAVRDYNCRIRSANKERSAGKPVEQHSVKVIQT